MTKLQITGYSLIVLAIGVLTYVAVKNNDNAGVPLVFSEKSMLEVLWKNYKETYLEKDTGRALDKQQDNITTSEGQSYALMQAVWMDDKPTFDLALKWTMENLKRPDDNLFSWLFGKKADGTYGVLTERGGQNAATDADSDIALALLFAHSRWGDEYHYDTALAIINDIWEHEVVMIAGKPYLAANNLEKTLSEKPIINVSYFSPYAYRIFAKVDPNADHDWMALVDTSYEFLNKTAASPLDKQAFAGLPPDWAVINKRTANPEPTNLPNLTTNFSYDALRTPWRIALDHAWFEEPRAKEYLDKLSFLSEQWKQNNTIGTIYGHDGSVIQASEAPAMYGGIIGYFKVSDPALAAEVYEQKLKYLFSPDTNTFKTELSYYDSNWAWFGIALYNNLLPNLSTH